MQVSGCGFRISGLGFRVSGFKLRVSSFRVRVSGFGFRISGLGFGIHFWGFIIRTSEASASESLGAPRLLVASANPFASSRPWPWFRVSDFGFQILCLCFGFRVSGFGFRIPEAFWRLVRTL